ncbi:MAG: 30S ribosomal protein S6 [Acidobacteriota bacterium]|nr:30S ribosomal protein S6 [Acidobacteriota bacterium]
MTASLNEYETVFILDPVVEESKEKEEVDRVVKWITDLGGVDVEVERWGRRRLAYEINKRRDGIYNVLRYRAPGTAIKDLERRMRLNENLLRVLTIVIDKKHREAMEAAKAAEEAAAAAGSDSDSDDDSPSRSASGSDSRESRGSAPAKTDGEEGGAETSRTETSRTETAAAGSDAAS